MRGRRPRLAGTERLPGRKIRPMKLSRFTGFPFHSRGFLLAPSLPLGSYSAPHQISRAGLLAGLLAAGPGTRREVIKGAASAAATLLPSSQPACARLLALPRGGPAKVIQWKPREEGKEEWHFYVCLSVRRDTKHSLNGDMPLAGQNSLFLGRLCSETRQRRSRLVWPAWGTLGCQDPKPQRLTPLSEAPSRFSFTAAPLQTLTLEKFLTIVPHFSKVPIERQESYLEFFFGEEEEAM